MLDKIFYFLFDFRKSIKHLILWILTALILLIIGLNLNIKTTDSKIVFEVLRYPFKFVSDILKSLALSGAVGNIIALIILTFISITPLIVYFLIRIHKNNTIRIIDTVFFIIISVLIGLIIYYQINPSLITTPLDNFEYLNEDIVVFLKQYQNVVILGLIFVLSIVILLYIIYYLALYIRTNHFNLFTAANILLIILKISYIILFIVTFNLMPLIMKNEFNALSKDVMGRDYFVTLIIFKYIFTYFVIMIFYNVLTKLYFLLENFRDEILFSENNVSLLKKCSNFLIIYLIIDTIYQLIYNGFQLIVKSKLHDINFNFSLPLTPIVLALVFYLLSLIMEQSYKIYKENSLTI